MNNQNKKIEDLKNAYKITFGSNHGKQVLDDLSKRCHEFSTTHVKGDSHESAFFEGQRSILVWIKSIINSKT